MQLLIHTLTLLVVRRADGGVVTVADVVGQLSAHFIKHKDEILGANDAMIVQVVTVDTKFFFNKIFSDIEADQVALPVLLWADSELGESVEEHFN